MSDAENEKPNGASCGCGTGTAYQALKRLAPSGLDTMVVFGQGPVGVAATLIGTALGARVIAIDTVDERLALGKRFGAIETLNASKVDVVTAIKDLTGGDGAVYMQATVFALPGDRLYSYRLQGDSPEIFDTCLIRWTPPKEKP